MSFYSTHNVEPLDWGVEPLDNGSTPIVKRKAICHSTRHPMSSQSIRVLSSSTRVSSHSTPIAELKTICHSTRHLILSYSTPNFEPLDWGVELERKTIYHYTRHPMRAGRQRCRATWHPLSSNRQSTILLDTQCRAIWQGCRVGSTMAQLECRVSSIGVSIYSTMNKFKIT